MVEAAASQLIPFDSASSTVEFKIEDVEGSFSELYRERNPDNEQLAVTTTGCYGDDTCIIL